MLVGGSLAGGRWEQRSGTLGVVSETPVTAMDLARDPASNSPQYAADPTDGRFVVLGNRMDAPAFNCALQVSGDGGRRWATADPVPSLPEGADTCYAPEVAFDRQGVLYYLFVGLAGAGNEPMGVFLTTSADQARSFTPPRQVLGPFNFGVRMAIDTTMGDRGRMHLVWLHATSDPPLGGFGPPPNPILASYSDDGGRTFSASVQVNDATRSQVVAPALALGPRHRVEVGYYDLGDDARDYQGLEGPRWEGRWALVVSSSADGGRRFGPGTVVDPEVIPVDRVMLIFTMPPPSLVAGPKATCVAWTDARHGDADALVSCKQGPGWRQPGRLNDDRLGNGLRQYLPRLSLSPDGRIDALFYDRRDDAGNLGTWVYYTYSNDGGRSFAPNMKVTPEPFDPRIGQQYGVVSASQQVEFGSRLGLWSRRHDALAAWTDTRNADPNSTGQDIFTAEVALAGRVARGRPLGVLLVAVAAAVLVATAISRRRAVGRTRRTAVEAIDDGRS